jgi:hypothetical protein
MTASYEPSLTKTDTHEPLYSRRSVRERFTGSDAATRRLSPGVETDCGAGGCGADSDEVTQVVGKGKAATAWLVRMWPLPVSEGAGDGAGVVHFADKAGVGVSDSQGAAPAAVAEAVGADFVDRHFQRGGRRAMANGSHAAACCWRAAGLHGALSALASA